MAGGECGGIVWNLPSGIAWPPTKGTRKPGRDWTIFGEPGLRDAQVGRLAVGRPEESPGGSPPPPSGAAASVSGRNLLDGLLQGRDPEQMVAEVKGKARKKIPALLDALGQGLDEGECGWSSGREQALFGVRRKEGGGNRS